MHSQPAPTQTTTNYQQQQMRPSDRGTAFSSTPPVRVSRSIKIVLPTQRHNLSQLLQQANYEALINSRDDVMYHRIVTSRGTSAPLATMVDNSLPEHPNESRSTYCGEEGIFEIDL